MAKEYDFRWQIEVPEALREGAVFDRWEEETGIYEFNVFARVDEYGFFLYWLSDGKDAQILEISQISEARQGCAPKEPKLLFDLQQKGTGLADSIEARTLCIVNGMDFVNLNMYHFVAQDEVTKIKWVEGINSIIHNVRVIHICPMNCLKKHWTMLCLSVNEKKMIPAKTIAKTFASGKNVDKNLFLNFKEVGLCENKNDEVDPKEFTFDKFYELYRKILKRSDVDELFKKLSQGKDSIGPAQMVTFLNEKQRDPRLNEILFPFFTVPRILQLIERYEPDQEMVKKGVLGPEGFLKFLLSDENAPVFLDRVEMYQDMDQNLAHYYINSSHNTYLVGRQFGGRSSVEMYRQVLLSGCRCVELDCWDGTGEDKGEPIITHGKAMCTDILFKDVITAIAETAFLSSDYPVILSFENHCSKANQLKMARYCVEGFADLLLTKPLDSHPLDPGVPLPGPNALKRKILIKNKRLKADVEKAQLEQFFREGKLDEPEEEPESAIADEDETLAAAYRPNPPPWIAAVKAGDPKEGQGDDTTSEEGESEPEEELQGMRPSPRPEPRAGIMVGVGGKKVELPIGDEAHPELKSQPSTGNAAPESATFKSRFKNLTKMGDKKDEVCDPQLSKEEEDELLAQYHYTGATTNIHPYLSSLVNYSHPIKFQGFDVSEAANVHFHMSSFSESTGLGYLKQNAIEFVNYNKRQLSRIYPKGGRVDSSNYLPQIFWNTGCQMVSLNFQTPDLAMQLNQGKFEYNLNCGYLLKPDCMRRPDRLFDPFFESPVDGVIAAYCAVQVISGQFISDRKIGTYVEVEMYGLPTDTIRKEFRTRIVPANGLNPIYNDEPFVFRKVVLPDLAVLRLAVYEESGKLLGQRILPMDGLQAGYRHISLRTETNLPMTLPTLFCNIVLKTYVPEGLGDLVEALSDPRGYLTMMEKRQKDIENLGFSSDDIEQVPVKTKTGASASKTGTPGSSSATFPSSGGSMPNAANNPHPGSTNSQPTSCRDEKIIFDSIKTNELKKDKTFQKVMKRLQKEMDDLRKKHKKDREAISGNQCNTIDKIVIDFDKVKIKEEKRWRKRSTNSHSGRPGANNIAEGPVDDDKLKTMLNNHHEKVRTVVVQQTKEWSDLIRSQQNEEYMLNKQHTREQWDCLRKLLDEAQKEQIRVLRSKNEIQTKNLRQAQTKKSMDASRQINTDKSIKTKGEKDRRVKELHEKNLKLFLDERKRLARRHDEAEEALKKVHIEQKEAIEKEAKKALELQDQIHQEVILSAKPEAVC